MTSTQHQHGITPITMDNLDQLNHILDSTFYDQLSSLKQRITEIKSTSNRDINGHSNIQNIDDIPFIADKYPSSLSSNYNNNNHISQQPKNLTL